VSLYTHLSESVVHLADTGLRHVAVDPEEDLGLGSCGHLETGVDVNQVLETLDMVPADIL